MSMRFLLPEWRDWRHWREMARQEGEERYNRFFYGGLPMETCRICSPDLRQPGCQPDGSRCAVALSVCQMTRWWCGV